MITIITILHILLGELAIRFMSCYFHFFLFLFRKRKRKNEHTRRHPDYASASPASSYKKPAIALAIYVCLDLRSTYSDVQSLPCHHVTGAST